ncbi:Uncharacterised protein [Mycobacteroides abscessus subsp. abscessus]|nr:Uncharacterised protein [Mycobacteroides abscessus subsp. abscessus]
MSSGPVVRPGAGLCCICFNSVTADNAYVDSGGDRWDFHRGKCAVLAGEVPAEYQARFDNILAWIKSLETSPESRVMALREYYRLVDEVTDEDFGVRD